MARYSAARQEVLGLIGGKSSSAQRLELARSFTAAVIDAFWQCICTPTGVHWPIKQLREIKVKKLPARATDAAVTLGALIAEFPIRDAGYLIGTIYTAMMPPDLRAELGAFYTPPPLAERLVDQAEGAGWDASNGSVCDPACGGAAFLAPVALRMWSRSLDASPEWTLMHIASRLKGIEIDPFSAWLSEVLLEAALLPLCVAADRRMPDVVIVGNALSHDSLGPFDLVVGNPPYGRVRLTAEQRHKWKRSLYGHSNLYGLFSDLALRLCRRGGVVAYLTPTSFLGGQYYTSLRRLLMDEATPVAMDFISDRLGVFEGVLQEIMLTTYICDVRDQDLKISLLIPKGLDAASVEPVASCRLERNGKPWLLPRAPDQTSYFERLRHMPTRLRDLGYEINTGQLVWNRHKRQLRDTKANNCFPLIWAESITRRGFSFRAQNRNHVPYIEVCPRQPHLVTRKECVLLQRTTAKEQGRRLLAALMPQEFLDQHGGAVVENHVNIVQPMGKPKISAATIEALINTAAVDRAFRCLNGSVAVSAYELEATPLPTVSQLRALEKLLREGASVDMVEAKVASFYGE